jgi:hypothetical protein
VATFDGVRWALADPQAAQVTVRSMPMAIAIPVRTGRGSIPDVAAAPQELFARDKHYKSAPAFVRQCRRPVVD